MSPLDYEVSPEDEIKPFDLINILLRHWKLVIGLPLAVAVVTAAVSLVLTPIYTATVTFAPEASASNRVPGGLAGLAGQIGISLGGELGQSPDFYAEVLQSRELIHRVLLTRFAVPGSERSPPDSATLLSLLEVDGDDGADSLYRGRMELVGQVSVAVDRETGIVQMSVDDRYPVLAAAVANAFVRYLSEFNAQTRQSKARELRKFTEERLGGTERELNQAEEDLRGFYERNRTWQQSPQLTVEEDRLRRRVQIRQEVYLTLNREYETARIEEVNDTPVITIIDPAIPPQERSKPQRKVLVILALVFGGIVSMFSAFIAAYVERVRNEDQGDYREFRRLLGQIALEVREIGSRLLRRNRERRAAPLPPPG